MRGWLALISKAKGQRQVFAYEKLHDLLVFFCRIPILDFDGAASEQLSILGGLRLRVGAMDLKIATIARSKKALLLSANLADFQRVPDLRVEDWTR
jgi:tRNA(fMet)-specific endonuclease VapC